MASPADIELLFGVKGGGKPSGESAVKIKRQLDNIINNINKKPLEVAIKIDEGHFKNFQQQLSNLTSFAKSEAQKIQDAYNFTFPSPPSPPQTPKDTGSSAGGGSRKKAGLIAENSSEMISALATLQEYQVKINKLLKSSAFASSADGKSVRDELENINKSLNVYKTLVEQGSVHSDAFAADMKDVAAGIRKAKSELELLGENKRVISFDVDSDEYSKALVELNKLLTTTRKNYESWTAAAHGATESDYSGLRSSIKYLEQLHDELISGQLTYEDYKKKVAGARKNIDLFSSNIRAAGKDTKNFGDTIKDLAGKFSRWFSVSQVVMGAVRTTKQMVATVTELDTAMTELRKVTDETEVAYENFLDNASVRAKELGATLTDVVSASADFARLGHGLEDASTLADVAIVYKNVGDGIKDIETASKSIISTMQAFGIEARNTMSIVDSFNAVGNNFAVSSYGIGEALLNSAAALAAAGNNIHESVALIAAANTTIQDPSRVGTALKTVSMYMRAAKTEAEEAGLSTEYMADSVSELREELLALTGNRVDIMSDVDAGEYKNTVEILRELSKIWDELSETSRTNITELIGGGVRNANVIASLMSNFKIVEDALATSMDSAGSALAENEKYLDSIQGKVNKLNASWETLSSVVVDTDLVKGVVDAGRMLVDTLTWIIDKFGGLGVALAAAPLMKAVSQIKQVKDVTDSLKGSFSSLAGGAKRRPYLNTPAIS